MLFLIDKTFTQHGGDSLTALQFTAVVKELFGVNLNVDTLLSSNLSLDQLGNMISSHCSVVTNGNSTIDLMKSDMDLELPRFNGYKIPSEKTKDVFLTGAYALLQLCTYVCPYVHVCIYNSEADPCRGLLGLEISSST